MTEEELNAEAKKLGYVVSKKTIYQCSCYMTYPNECHKNRKWKCVDKYKPIKFKRKWRYGPMTKCVRVEPQEKEHRELTGTKEIEWKETREALGE